MGSEKRDITPVLLKFGVALALSFGGVMYTLIINKRSKAPSQSQRDPRKHHSDLYCNKLRANSRSIHLNFDPLATTDKHEDLHYSNNTKSPKGYSRVEKDTYEQEINCLRNTIKILKERESNLEIELLEYYGLKEQETAVMELQNRLKLNNMEAKLFAFKIESLQAENRRLESQMSDYKKVVTNLESARTRIKMLKKKIRSESEHNKKQILDFQQRVQKMQEYEKKVQSEIEELRKSNRDLQLENADLGHRLDCVQILATSVLEDGEVSNLFKSINLILSKITVVVYQLSYLIGYDDLIRLNLQTEKVKEESQKLKKQNEELSKEIERIQADRCADVEEVVYLRWINACLRYELRNYQPKPGKTSARDLSKSLSPKSEEKAKQLILEYANKEGEIDSDQWSISQASIVTDSGEFDEAFIDEQLPHKSSNKFFGKLMRVLRGKESPNHHHHRNHSRNSSLGRSESGGDDIISCGSPENQRLRTPSERGSQRLTHRHSDSSFYKQIDSVTEGGGGNGGGRRSCSSSSYGQKSGVARYAEALKDSRPAANFKSHRSSPSLTLF